MHDFLTRQSGSIAVTAGTTVCFLIAATGFAFAFFPHANPIAKVADERLPAATTGAVKTPKVIPVGPITDKNALPPPVAPSPAPSVKSEAPVPVAETRAPLPVPQPRQVVAPPPPVTRKTASATTPEGSEKPAPRPKPAPVEAESSPAPKKGGTGFLTVDAVPWADVTIDSQSADRTPIAELPLGSGTHIVEFKNDEIGVRLVRKVTITSGGSKTLRVDLGAEAAKKAKQTEGDGEAKP